MANRAREELREIIQEDKPGYVRTLFDAIAADYNRMNWIMTAGLLALWHRSFLRATGLSPGETALDVCCGTGDLTLLMARRVGPGGRVVGLDFSENMLDIARRRGGGFGPSLSWRRGDALDLPFPDGGERAGFHVVSMGFALRNVDDIAKSLREMARVARRGGRIVCLEVSRPEHAWIRAGFHAYFFHVVPILGRLAERRIPKESPLRRLRPYTYLPYSLEHLPAPARVVAMMRESGLEGARRIPLTGGLVSLYVGVKP